MYDTVEKLKEYRKKLTVIISNGFEERATRGVELLKQYGIKPERIILLRYAGKEHNKNQEIISTISKELVGPSRYKEIDSGDYESLNMVLGQLEPERDRVVCDITGLSRVIIFSVLTRVYKRNLLFSLLYTEAAEYYPLEREFKSIIGEGDTSDAFKEDRKTHV